MQPETYGFLTAPTYPLFARGYYFQFNVNDSAGFVAGTRERAGRKIKHW